MNITVYYDTIDRFRTARKFKTLKGARAYATKWVGDHPDIGSCYAVSQDGVGKVYVEGISLDDLFNKPLDAEPVMVETADQKAEREWHEWEAQSEWEAFGRLGRG